MQPRPRRILFLLLILVCAPLAQALTGPLPYDANADAGKEVAQALALSKQDHKSTLLIFGANWCEDCRALDAALHSAKNAALMRAHFRVVKIDVGNFDRHLDISKTYGDPIQKGIPAAVVIGPDGKQLYTTAAGELANARKMSEDGVYAFFQNIVQPQPAHAH